MEKELKIYIDGGKAHTANVMGSTARMHVGAGSPLADESRCLLDFIDKYEEKKQIPLSLFGGLSLMCEGEDATGKFALYFGGV